MLLIQVFLSLFFLFAISRVAIRYRNKELNLSNTIFWLAFWFLAIFIVIWPDSTFYISKLVGVTRGADLVVYVSLALLFFFVFKLTIKIEKQERNITRLTRKLSLKENKKD